MRPESLFVGLSYVVVAGPLGLLSGLGLSSLANRPPSERTVARCTQYTIIVTLLAAVGLLVTLLAAGTSSYHVDLGHWMQLPDQHFDFHLSLVLDWLSLPFAILSIALIGTVGAFANNYLHREPGYRRFFLLLAVFLLGMVLAALAGTIETLFLGWELVGLSSALLVAFFQERRAPLEHGQYVWSIYRISDAAFLGAAVVLHHSTSGGTFMGFAPNGHDPVASLTANQSLVVGLLLLVAVAGKSGLIPFSGWLPRAMEGPTPSSAIFYGALSVHLGAYLLLRVSPMLETSVIARVAVVTLGLASALYASLAARVQSDIKSALAFASLTQVGIIVAEIGLGLQWVPLIHIIGHACLRTLQLLRAPSLLQDYREMEAALGTNLPTMTLGWAAILPPRFRGWLYRFSLERGGFDAFLWHGFAEPVLRLFRWFDRLEQRVFAVISGGSEARAGEGSFATRLANDPAAEGETA